MEYWNKEMCLIFPIWCDIDKHPMNNEISFLYVRFRDDETDNGPYKMDYILPFNHNDCEKLDIDLTTSTQSKKVFNKKGLLQTNLDIQNMYDIQTELFFEEHKTIDILSYTEVLTNFYRQIGLRDDLGKSISIMKWVDVIREITNPLVNTSEFTIIDSWIDNTLIPILSRVEQNGIRVVPKKFIDRFSKASKQLKGDTIFTEYNPYTMTSRPSNRHGGVNYGALKKKDGTRKIFIPREGKRFLQYDYDAYHVRIIAKMVDFKIPHESGHQWLADQYGCSYKNSKGRTFRILYGGVRDEDRKIPFFDLVDKHIQKMYRRAKIDGYVCTYKGRKIYLDWFDRPNPQKVFNYILQATETELNIEIIKKLYENNITSLCLYTYDSFLFEIGRGEGDSKAEQIKEIVESFDFPVKASWGDDLSRV